MGSFAVFFVVFILLVLALAGLGLALAQGLIELHGGQILAVEKGPQTSEFQIAIPQAEG